MPLAHFLLVINSNVGHISQTLTDSEIRPGFLLENDHFTPVHLIPNWTMFCTIYICIATMRYTKLTTFTFTHLHRPTVHRPTDEQTDGNRIISSTVT